jgi:hypothetical protein
MATFTYTSKTGMFVDDFETDHEAVDVYGLLGAVKTVSVGIGALRHGSPTTSICCSSTPATATWW